MRLQPLSEDQIRLVESQIENAKKTAALFFGKYHGAYPFDEFVSSAYEGVVEAATRYDATKGAAFSSFAYFYIVKKIRLVHVEERRANGWVYHNHGRSLRQVLRRNDWPTDPIGRPYDVADKGIVCAGGQSLEFITQGSL